MEGKELRFGDAGSALWAVVTTVASCGAVNGALDAFTGIGGAVPMANIMTGEVIFGGVGSGLYGMLLFVLLAVFIAGLMVGRTPEFLGKKIEAREIKLVVLGTIAIPLLVLVATALAVATKYGAPSIYNAGPQGFSETLYAYASQANNNGSAFAGYTGFVQPNARQRRRVRHHVRRPARRASRCSPAASCRWCSRSPSPARWPASGSRRPARARCAPTRRRSSCCSSRRSSSSPLLTFVPALLLGPVVQGLSDPALLGPDHAQRPHRLRRRDRRAARSCSASSTRSS